MALSKSTLGSMNSTAIARRLRREQTEEEKELWLALKAGRFAGFKFRRQHPSGNYFLDFYCAAARLSVELDGFQHGLPEQIRRDDNRSMFLAAEGIEELRFWNHRWRQNREGVLLEIWDALHRRTGWVKVARKEQNHRFLPPKPEQLVEKPAKPSTWRPSSPQPSPPSDGGEGVKFTGPAGARWSSR
jgi:very-short-patch-repair endonuclease